jgi:hypothetical protein
MALGVTVPTRGTTGAGTVWTLPLASADWEDIRATAIAEASLGNLVFLFIGEL